MANTVRLQWDGAVYELAKLKLVEADRIGELQEALAATGVFRAKIVACREMLQVLHCPPEIIESVDFDRYEELVTALFAVQMGAPTEKAEGVDPPGNASDAGEGSRQNLSGEQLDD